MEEEGSAAAVGFTAVASVVEAMAAAASTGDQVLAGVDSEGAASRKGQAALVVDSALLTHRIRLVAAGSIVPVALVACRGRIDRTSLTCPTTDLGEDRDHRSIRVAGSLGPISVVTDLAAGTPVLATWVFLEGPDAVTSEGIPLGCLGLVVAVQEIAACQPSAPVRVVPANASIRVARSRIDIMI